MKSLLILFALCSVCLSNSHAECKKHIALHSAKHVAKEFGKTEMWVLQNYKVKVWANPSPKKFPKVGDMLPGSRAIIIEEGPKDYKVRSPLDKSEGWVSKVQVSRTLMQDDVTRKECG